MSDHPVKRRKKLIEVAIPLEAMNEASAREKSIRRGHPSTFHRWWARRPLATARAIIFCQLVDDPSSVPEEFPTIESQEIERTRLFRLISEMVQWENIDSARVLENAKNEIDRSWERACTDNANHPEAAGLFKCEKPPIFHDPFSGGGALPLEAHKLGLETLASDLNPIAVLINKASVEVPAIFRSHPPVNPNDRNSRITEWKGAEGIASDLKYYGEQVTSKLRQRIGKFYNHIKISDAIVNDKQNPRPDLEKYLGEALKPIAYLWTRTAVCENPGCQKRTPLLTSFVLSSKKGNEFYLNPIVTEGGATQYHVSQRPPERFSAFPQKGLKRGTSGIFECIHCGTVSQRNHIANEGLCGRLDSDLVAVVLEGRRERVFISSKHYQLPELPEPSASIPLDLELSPNPRDVWCRNFGLTKVADLFTSRQRFSLLELTRAIDETRDEILADAEASASHKKILNTPLDYADAICLYLYFARDKVAEGSSTLCTWSPLPKNLLVISTFGRQALPMTWDFAEANILGDSAGNFEQSVKLVASVIEKNFALSPANARSFQQDARKGLPDSHLNGKCVISTDPPYYDNIGYADLSDFFYPWLRGIGNRISPGLFSTIASPKKDELVALPYRHKSKDEAEQEFLKGMREALSNLATSTSPVLPVTIYYAFKQSETKADSGTTSTGWETFLRAVVDAGFEITSTWPVRTERSGGFRNLGQNALASSLVLSCRKRLSRISSMTRSEFRKGLQEEVPVAIKFLEKAGLAPADMSQAAIGVGMSLYSRVESVLLPDDSSMTVKQALSEIRKALDDYLSSQGEDYDLETKFALTFFESYGLEERPFGDAEALAIAFNVSVQGVVESGVLRSVAGKARLIQRTELQTDWDPAKDKRLCIWEATQHLIRMLEASGESAAAELLGQLKKVQDHGDLAGNCQALAYRLYNHCEKNKDAEEARAYNGLVIAWPELERLASNQPTETAVQASLI